MPVSSAEVLSIYKRTRGGRHVAGAFGLVAVEGHGVLEDGDFNLNGRRLEPLKVEQVKVLLRPKDPGVFALRPRILYLDEDGVPRTHEVEQIDVTVLA